MAEEHKSRLVYGLFAGCVLLVLFSYYAYPEHRVDVKGTLNLSEDDPGRPQNPDIPFNSIFFGSNKEDIIIPKEDLVTWGNETHLLVKPPESLTLHIFGDALMKKPVKIAVISDGHGTPITIVARHQNTNTQINQPGIITPDGVFTTLITPLQPGQWTILATLGNKTYAEAPLTVHGLQVSLRETSIRQGSTTPLTISILSSADGNVGIWATANDGSEAYLTSTIIEDGKATIATTFNRLSAGLWEIEGRLGDVRSGDFEGSDLVRVS